MSAFSEKVEQYMQCEKRTLAELLAMREIATDREEYPFKFPYYPGIDYSQPCSDWGHCSNPFHDCVNCPLRFTTGGGSWTTTWTTRGTDKNEGE